MYIHAFIYIPIDIDECLGKNKCTGTRICVNQPGNYRCECKVGYLKVVGKGRINCFGNQIIFNECTKYIAFVCFLLVLTLIRIIHVFIGHIRWCL